MGSMAPTTGGKALTFEKGKRDWREEEEKNNTDATCFL